MKRMTVLLLALAMLLSLMAGCGGTGASAVPEAASSVQEAMEAPASEPEEAAQPEAEPEAAAAPEAEASAGPEASAAEPEEEPPETAAAPDRIDPPANPYTLPLSEDNASFTFFWTYPPFLAEMIEDLTDGYARQELEDRTGVHIEFDAVSAAVAGEQFQLMVAADSYADIIQDVTNYYTAGMDRAVMAEVEKKYGVRDWTSPFSSSIYWAHAGLARAEGNDRAFLVETIRQCRTILASAEGPVSGRREEDAR